MSPTDNTLRRFHRVLLQEITESRPDYLTQPFTVAEIYQNLVPYRSHRDLIGVEMNGDYEDVLLRLLAGEGDYLLLDSEVARREIRQELERASPNTGLFRDFAAADVRLNPDRLGEAVGDGADVGLFSRAVSDEDQTRDHSVGPHESDRVVGHIDLAEFGSVTPLPGTEAKALDAPPSVESGAPPAEEEEKEALSFGFTLEEPESPSVPFGGDEAETPAVGSATSPGVDAGQGSACQWCRQSLPHRETLNFCPFCGSDLNVVACPKCGDDLEPDWQFCVSCGTNVRE